jgi:cytochrome c5
VINRVTFSLLTVLVAASAFAQDLTDAQRAAIAERIKPAGETCMQGDDSCGVPAVVAAAGPRSGEEVYNAACMACHTTGAGGAPVVGDVEAWAPRIGQGIDVLHVSGVEGVPGTGMIAKGGCMSCSDEEIHAAVDFMVAGSQ